MNGRDLGQLATIAGLRRETALAELAATERRLRDLDDALAALRRQGADSGDGGHLSPAALSGQLQVWERFAADRQQALNRQIAEERARREMQRLDAARAVGQADVLAQLHLDALALARAAKSAREADD